MLQTRYDIKEVLYRSRRRVDAGRRGAELSVLKTVDFMRFSAGVIEVEYRKDSPGIEDFLTNKSYVRVESIGNTNVYLRPVFATGLEEVNNNEHNIDLSDILH